MGKLCLEADEPTDSPKGDQLYMHIENCSELFRVAAGFETMLFLSFDWVQDTCPL